MQSMPPSGKPFWHSALQLALDLLPMTSAPATQWADIKGANG